MTTETYKDTKITITQHKDGSHTVDCPAMHLEMNSQHLGVTLAMIKSLIDKMKEQ